MFTSFLVCVFLAGPALSSTPALSNHFMDEFLGTDLKNAIKFKSLDPKNLPTFQTNFPARIYFSHFNVHTEYSSGKLLGLSVVKRSQACSAPKWATSKTMDNATLNCTLTFPQLRVEYTGLVKSPINRLTVLASVNGVQIQVELIGRRTLTVPSLKDFSVTNRGSVEPKFGGLSTELHPTTHSNFTNTFANQVSGFVYQILTNEFKKAFADALRNTKNMPMPKYSQ